MTTKIRPVLIALALLAGGGQTSRSGIVDRIGDILAGVSADSLRTTIAGLQGFGTRYWSEPNRRDVALWILARLQGAGVTDVVLDSFEISGTWQYNVVGTIRGDTNPGQEIILGAHTDAVTGTPSQAPGADDNASGTAAVIEIARVLRRSGYAPRATWRFVGFAAEEIGLRGSESYANRAHAAWTAISAMLNFDMIGHRDASSPVREFTLVWYQGARWLMELDSAMARTYTTLVPVPSTVNASRSDSYSFWMHGYPAVFHYERGNNRTYHTVNDILDSLDVSYVAEITQTGLATAVNVDAGVEPPPPPPSLPVAVTLYQNFPNPFNPSTVIAFELPESRWVTLAIFDLLGREVASLVDGWTEAGSHTVRLGANGLASGVYLYRLTAGSATLTRRMVVVR
jgi:leucyl aminopeptidase